MKAVCFDGRNKVEVQTVPDPRILNTHDCIVRITSTAICGSDLHLYDGYVPARKGDILGHEFMGEVVEVGPSVRRLKVGDRVVVPAAIACGKCTPCEQGRFSLCENSNPNGWLQEKQVGYAAAGIFGFSEIAGGYAGGQAEYARVPFADVGPLKVPDGLRDEQVLFLSDIFPTGYMAAENADIKPGATVAVWGCGPVGLFAIKSAWLLGAGRVIAIDRFEDRLSLARAKAGAEVLNYEDVDVIDALKEMTGGRGPDSCIEAVGMEAHGAGLEYVYDRVKQAARLEMDRPIALRTAIQACRSGGTVSVGGFFGGVNDKFPMGAIMQRNLTIRSGQTHMQKYMRPLLDRIEKGEVDASFLVTHRMRLDEAPQAYELFKNKQDGCVKVVLKPV